MLHFIFILFKDVGENITSSVIFSPNILKQINDTTEKYTIIKRNISIMKNKYMVYTPYAPYIDIFTGCDLGLQGL